MALLRGSVTPPEGTAVASYLEGSWRRCEQRYRLDRSTKPYLVSLTRQELSAHSEPYEEYFGAVNSALEFVHSALEASSFCATFSDMAGIILRYQADPKHDGDLKHERPGLVWAEGAVGTNGVGTCVVEQRPIMVVGRQHYFSAYGGMSCIAAPVLSPDADMIGVLNVATADPNVTPETLKLAASLTSTMANRLSDNLFLSRFRQNAVLKVRDAGASSLIAFDEDYRIIGATRRARSTFGLVLDPGSSMTLWDVFDREAIDRIMQSGPLGDLHRLDNTAAYEADVILPAATPRKRLDAPAPTARPAPRPFAQTSSEPTIEECLGDSPKMRAMSKLLHRVSGSGLPILLLGETGAGKDTLARALHRRGDRRDKPFVAFNCAAVPESLIDSELFGYGTGAFTGAKREGNVGRFKQADGGTLFLDEIGDMPLALQTRLLRVLETGEISPLGSAHSETIDVRVVAATNNNLLRSIGEGRFRQDLYYRLAGVVVEMPALRDRSDLRAIVDRLLAADANGPSVALSDEALAALMTHSWPGNIRELRFVLHRARRICENGIVTVGDLMLPTAATPAPTVPSSVAPSANVAEADIDPRQPVHDAERQLIRETLARCGNDVSSAAAFLRMSRATLYRRMRHHNISARKILS
jgi:transcriptional regulator of acetoin/glycerol metabolism